MRNDIDVSFETMNVTFKLATDDGFSWRERNSTSSFSTIYYFTLWLDNDTNKTFGKKLNINVN